MGMSLPYGVRTLDMEDFWFPISSTSKFTCENDNEGFLDAYSWDPNLDYKLILFPSYGGLKEILKIDFMMK
jgi:hypothetical protein